MAKFEEDKIITPLHPEKAEIGKKEKCNSCGLRQKKRINLEKENVELKAQIENLETVSASKDECIDNLEYQLKDAGGELELWQRENAELKKTNALLYDQEKEKIKLIEKMKCCMNCVHCEINQEWHLFCNADSVINFNANFCEKWELAE